MRAEPSWMGLVPLWMRPPENSLASSALGGHRKQSVSSLLSRRGKRVLTQPGWHPDLRLPGSRLWAINLLFTSYQVYSILFSQPKQTKTPSNPDEHCWTCFSFNNKKAWTWCKLELKISTCDYRKCFFWHIQHLSTFSFIWRTLNDHYLAILLGSGENCT